MQKLQYHTYKQAQRTALTEKQHCTCLLWSQQHKLTVVACTAVAVRQLIETSGHN